MKQNLTLNSLFLFLLDLDSISVGFTYHFVDKNGCRTISRYIPRL